MDDFSAIDQEFVQDPAMGNNIILGISVVLTVALAIWGLIAGIGNGNWEFGTFLGVYALLTAWAGGVLASRV